MLTTFLFIAASALLPFSNGRWMHAAAGILGPVLLTLFIRRFPIKKGLLYGFLILLCTSFISWITVNKVVSGSLLYAGVFLAVIAMLVPYAVDRFFRPTGDSSFVKTFYMPLAWVSMDAIFSLLIADQGSIAYSQFENLPVLQLASITGYGGITFLMAWAASTASWIFENKGHLKNRRSGIYFFIFIIAAVLEFGLHRLSTQPPEGDLIPVAAITSNATSKPGIKKLLEKSKNAHESGARMILWSEGLADSFDGIKDFTEKNGVFLFAAAGFSTDNKELLDNKVVLFDPAGEELLSYRKSHLSPGEPSLQGEKKFRYLDTLSGRFGVAICADLSYSHFIREAGKNGVDVLFDPAAEWRELERIQTAVPIMRAVENGFNLVKATSNGHSLVADFTGRIIAETDKPSEETLIASVPNRGLGTVYAMGGWLFSYFILLLTIIILPVAFKRGHISKEQK